MDSMYICSNSQMSTHQPFRRPGQRSRSVRSVLKRLLAFALAIPAVSWVCVARIAGVDAATPPAALEGVVAAPEGLGARVEVLLSGSFRYMIAPDQNRIVVTLDGVTAETATYHLAAGPVTGVTVLHPAGRPGLLDIVIATRTPLDVAESFLGEHSLVIRLTPKGLGATRSPNPPRIQAPPVPKGTKPPLPAGESAPVLAGRAVIPRAVRVEAGSGQLIQVDGLMRVAVSDPRVLGAVPISNRELLVTGRSAGHTTMYVWEGAGRLLAYAVDVLPAEDRLAGLRRLFGSLFPRADITVAEAPGAPGGVGSQPPALRDGPPAGGRPPLLPGAVAPGEVPVIPYAGSEAIPAPAGPSAPAGSPAPRAASNAGGGIILSGAVETQMDRQRADAVARAFAPTVVNLLNVRRPVQLKLQVEVVELSRSALRTLGITWGGGQQTPGAPPSLNGGVYNLQLITSPGAATAGLELLIAQIQALTQDGRARLLAEPSLVVLAGRTASLLLGGQVPIPVAGPNGSVTIEYRDFGVILNAHPDYQDDGRVFMQIAPEVSTLDFANAIKVSGFTIPALRVRRAQTVVSMRPAETLVVGGLLQEQDSDLLQKVPVLGDLPIIGPLFRSKTFQRQETDLVIFVTPILIETGGVAPPAIP